jgi:predicted alpha-1,2-mannosidase
MLALPPHFNAGNYRSEIHEMSEMAAVEFGQYAHSNQPVHHVLFLFAAAGAPHKTQYWTRRVLEELYAPTPDGFPGDEDNGETGAWYVLAALGFYPLTPGHGSYVLTSPLFRRATVHLPSGADLVIEAEGNSDANRYVQSTTFDGAPHTAAWIAHRRLVAGGTLRCVMGAEPNARALGGEELPYSLSTHGIGG